ncbi:MAG: 6-hydroxymethylpterin diphosphokinase MptE-like protein [Ruminococcus sp.]|nr:6-hydroxymethylpterin diphosphokinase MptE-like protein [Ruminococcus sp.]
MNPVKSMIARRQSKIIENFGNSGYGKALKPFCNSHTGEKCFVIGNGPSLTPEDLSVLSKNNVDSFAANRIYNTFDKTDWRPAYFISEDEFVLAEIADKLNSTEINSQLGKIFIPIQMKFYKNIEIANALYFKQLFADLKDSRPHPEFISDDMPSGIPCRGSVAITSAQMAMYMGYSEIYLIGVDHNFSRMADKNGNVIVDKTVKDHYGDVKNADENTKGIFNIDAATQSFIDLKAYGDKKGVKIYNATRGGKLEVFPRVDFDSLFM